MWHLENHYFVFWQELFWKIVASVYFIWLLLFPLV